MYQYVYGGTLFGVEGRLVQVEVDISRGLPSFEMGGRLSQEIKESRERVRTGLKNAGFPVPASRICISLAPADLPKSGTGFDLPIAAALMAAMGLFPPENKEDALFMGEVELSGKVRPVKGVLSVVSAAKDRGITKCFVPVENMEEAAVWPEISVVGIHSIGHLKEVLSGTEQGKEGPVREQEMEKKALDFSQVWGMSGAKRAAEIAAAGMHNLLLIGPPGSGKTMVSSRIPGIMPGMELEEQIEITKIYSSRGLNIGKGLLKNRPFRHPHHTLTKSAMTGGGLIPRAGEMTLAHKGVLFLDELPEFDPKVLDCLRQPLEEGWLTISRTYGIYRFPCDFMLVAAMNPCRCGYYPDRNRCFCTEAQIRNYRSRISRPLLERFDLYVEVPALGYEQLRQKGKRESSGEIQKRVEKARTRQKERLSPWGLAFNSQMTTELLERYCSLGFKEERLLKRIFEAFHFSARAYGKVLKTARTIADLAGSEKIEEVHLQEAASYRRAAEVYWGGTK